MRFGHIGLTCADLERSKSFFSVIFGFEPFFEVRRKTPWLAAQVGYPDADISFCHMRGAGGIHLELLQYHHPECTMAVDDETYQWGNMHMCLLVEDAQALADRAEEWMKAATATTIGLARFAPDPLDIEATTVPDGPNKGDKGFYMRDPDGHSIEVIQKKAVSPTAEELPMLDPNLAMIISKMEGARSVNNRNWLELMKLAARAAPAEARAIFETMLSGG